MATMWAPEQLAEYAVVFSYLAVLQTLPLLGLGFAVARDAAAAPDREGVYLRAAMLISATASVTLVIALGVGGGALYGERLSTAFWAAGLTLLATGFVCVFESQMMGLNRLGVIAAMNSVENLGRLAAFLSVAGAHGGLVDFLALLGLLRAGVALAYFAMPSTRAAFRIPAAGSLHQVIVYLRSAPSYLGAVVAGGLISRLDVLCLSALVPPAELGIYALAARIYEMAMMVPVTFTMALFPVLARVHAKSPGEFRRFAQSTLGIVVTAAVVVSICTILATDPIMKLLFSPPYTEAAPSVRALLVAAALASVGQVLASIIVVCHQQTADLVVQIAALLVLPTVLLFAVSQIGLHGASIGVLAAVVIQVFGRYLVCYRRLIGEGPREVDRATAVVGHE
jgi:O-antigen/teichoic acid export membrane protein